MAGPLDRQSGSSEWTVAQVLSHLGSAAEIGLATLTAGQADMAGAQAVWDRWNAMSPADQATGSVAAGERLVRAFEALDDDALAHRRIDVGFLPEPVDVGFLAGMRLSEMGLHLWDVEVAGDPDATVVPYVVPFVLKQLPLFAGFFAKPVVEGVVSITTVDPAGSYLLQLGPDGARFAPGNAEDAGTRVRLSAEALVRLSAGRLAVVGPVEVHVEGALTLDDLRRVFPGY
jgi:uncharacterized protein (TIGR03083 family)